MLVRESLSKCHRQMVTPESSAVAGAPEGALGLVSWGSVPVWKEEGESGLRRTLPYSVPRPFAVAEDLFLTAGVPECFGVFSVPVVPAPCLSPPSLSTLTCSLPM